MVCLQVAEATARRRVRQPVSHVVRTTCCVCARTSRSFFKSKFPDRYQKYRGRFEDKADAYISKDEENDFCVSLPVVVLHYSRNGTDKKKDGEIDGGIGQRGRNTSQSQSESKGLMKILCAFAKAELNSQCYLEKGVVFKPVIIWNNGV